jgi:FixJ family two-component response regulator
MTRATSSQTVIVVDDDAAVRASLKFSLELEGFCVEVHESGEALDRSGSELREGCLVLDYELPGRDGLQVLDGLRRRDVRLPAILIASRPPRAVRLAAFEAGVPIVEKPLMSDGLLTTVRRALAAGPPS